MQLSHTVSRTSVAFDDLNLVSPAGLVPVLALADRAGLRVLADEWLTVPTDKGAHAGLKVTSLVAGMVAGADSIDDMALLRHGGMGKIFTGAYAPSTLGSVSGGMGGSDNTGAIRKLYVDDLVTVDVVRSGGYGHALLAELVRRARQLGCFPVDLDSGVQRHDAHRFYPARTLGHRGIPLHPSGSPRGTITG